MSDINDVSELRGVYRQPGERAVKKQLDQAMEVRYEKELY